MGDGLHELYIFAYDYAGNLKNVTFSFTCDDTNPTATFSGVANGMVLSETITITVSPSDANGIDFIIFYINDYLLANQSNDNTFPLDTRTYSDGAYDFKFEIYDIAGNCYEQQFSIEIKNKDTPPFIPGFNLELLFSISLYCIVITILKELKILNRKIAYKESST